MQFYYLKSFLYFFRPQRGKNRIKRGKHSRDRKWTTNGKSRDNWGPWNDVRRKCWKWWTYWKPRRGRWSQWWSKRRKTWCRFNGRYFWWDIGPIVRPHWTLNRHSLKLFALWYQTLSVVFSGRLITWPRNLSKPLSFEKFGQLCTHSLFQLGLTRDIHTSSIWNTYFQFFHELCFVLWFLYVFSLPLCANLSFYWQFPINRLAKNKVKIPVSVNLKLLRYCQ